MIDAILTGAKLIGDKNAQNSQTASSMADALGQGVPMKNWDDVGDDELKTMSDGGLNGFGGF